MRIRRRSTLSVLALCAAAAAADPTDDARRRFAIAGKLDVLSATVQVVSASDGPVRTALRCRLDRPGTYSFEFTPYPAGGRPGAAVLAVTWPAPPPSPHAAVLPGGIHGGPPRATNGDRGPTVTRDAADPAVVTVRWAYGDTAARGGPYGVELARCAFADPPATGPATVPSANR